MEVTVWKSNSNRFMMKTSCRQECNWRDQREGKNILILFLHLVVLEYCLLANLCQTWETWQWLHLWMVKKVDQ